MQKRRRMWGWVFVAPQFIGLLIFALIPLVMSFVISFHDWDGIADTMKFVGVKNYVHQVMDSDFQKALVNTVIYSIMYIPLNIVLALILALAVQKIKGKTLYRLFYFMPVVTGSVSVGVIWTWILNGDFGLLNSVLAVFGINGPKWLTDTHMVLLSIVIVSVWWNVGYNMVLLLAGLQNIPEVYYEAAEIDGASRWTKMWRITLPCISTSVITMLIISVGNIFSVNLDRILLMYNTGTYATADVIQTYVYRIAFQSTGFPDYSYGTAVNVLKSIIAFVLVFIVNKIADKVSDARLF